MHCVAYRKYDAFSVFREVQSIGGVFELLRPDSTPSEVVSYQVDWFKGLSDTPHKRSVNLPLYQSKIRCTFDFSYFESYMKPVN